MSTVERTTGRARRPLLRWIAAGSAALFLMSTAYQASWGQGNNDNYPDDDDDGLSTGEAVAIGVGGAAALYGLWLLLGADDDDDDEAGETEDEATLARAGSAGAVSGLRLVSDKRQVGAGERVALRLEARNAAGQWQDVTGSSNAAINVAGSSLQRMDGAKNAFCLPITAAASGSVVVTGSFARQGGAPMTTQTTIQLAGAG